MTDPKPPSRNCAGCNEPNPPHEMIDQRCLRCTHRELIDCRNALQIMTNAEDDARRELVRVRLRLDALTNAASVACAGYTTYKSEAAEYFGRDDDLASVPIEYMEELTAALVTETKDAPTAPTHEPNRVICQSCHNEIDPEMCRCGYYIKDHSFCEHAPVPMGCDCARDRSTPPTPEPSRNTAGLHEPVWDSRNSDEPKTEVAAPKPCACCGSTNNAPDSLKCDDCGRDA